MIRENKLEGLKDQENKLKGLDNRYINKPELKRMLKDFYLFKKYYLPCFNFSDGISNRLSYYLYNLEYSRLKQECKDKFGMSSTETRTQLNKVIMKLLWEQEKQMDIERLAREFAQLDLYVSFFSARTITE